MGNCLVTKLQESINIDAPKFGVATWELPANVTEYQLRLGNYRGQRLTWSGGIVVKDYQNNVLTSPYDVSPTATLNNMVKVSSGSTGGIMELKNKYNYTDSVGSTSEGLLKPLKYDYNLKSISYWFSGKYFNPVAFGDPTTNICPIAGNLEEIISCLSRNNVINISLQYCSNLEGDISTFGNLSTVTYLSIARCAKLTGSIANLGGMTNLSALLFYNVSNVGGNIEDFVAAQRTAGRTTASDIRVTGGGTGIKYNGSSIGYTNRTLSWTSDSITFI